MGDDNTSAKKKPAGNMAVSTPETTVSNRRSGIELLRIAAIVMITAYHYTVHGNFQFQGNGKLFLDLFSLGGKAGVNLFCLITGYFGICGKFRPSKLLAAEMHTLFYCLLGLLICCLSGMRHFSTAGLLMSIFPVLSEHYWYMTAYIMTCLFSPFLNRLIWILEPSERKKFMLLCLLIWCMIPFFTLRENSGMFWNQFIWFLVMYILGACLRLTPLPDTYSSHGTAIYIYIYIY